MLDLLRRSQTADERRETAEYINAHPSEFEDLVSQVFDDKIGEFSSQNKRDLLDITDLLNDTLIISVIQRAISDAVPEIRVWGLQAAYRTRIDSLNKYVEMILMNCDESFDARKWAVHILATTDPSCFGGVLRRIAKDQTEDVDIRKETVFALTNVADDECIGTLCALLGDQNREMRTSGAWALSRISSKDSIVCLLAALEDEYEEVRNWAIRGLRDMDDSRALQKLSDRMRIAPPEEQIRLIRLLVEKKSEIILRAITEILLSPDSEVRRAAAWAMGVSPYPPATRNLEVLLDDQDEQIRDYARTALTRLGKVDPTDFGLKL